VFHEGVSKVRETGKLPRIDRKFPLFDPLAHRFEGIFPRLEEKLLVDEGNLRRFEETLPQIEAN
jgi:hypothetical protein